MNKKLTFDPRKLLDDMQTFVAVLDNTGSIIFVNNTPLKASGLTLDEMLGTKFWDAKWWTYSCETVEIIKGDCEACKQGKILSHEVQLALGDGTLVWIEYSMHPILDDEGNVVYLVPEGRDITKKVEQEKILKQLAHYDPLTQLPNITLFEQKFQSSLEKRKNGSQKILAICFIDIDHFKPINDTYGHNEGDKLLMEIAKRLSSSIRKEDALARMGGDEFVMFFTLDSKEASERVLTRMIKHLSEPYHIENHIHHITASCGVTLFPEDNSDLQTLIRHADKAMYIAKTTGKNKFSFFDSASANFLSLKRNLEAEIIQTIEDNKMELYYQAKINMQTGIILGAEALIRWNHPDSGVLLPKEFIKYIEKTACMIILGQWVIKQALLQIQSWLEEGKDWSISINIDAYHFMCENFYVYLKDILEKTKMPLGEYLEIEILETEQFIDLEAVAKRIEECQSLGVKFALDDYGTGYSSLLYLKSLPIDWLKIDKSFVADILLDEKDRTLIHGIIELSKAFGINVIAEGIETIQQGEALIKLDCIHGQGYEIAKPMQADKFLLWAEQYRVPTEWCPVQASK